VLERLRQLRGVVVDMDGTLVLGDRNNHGLRLLPGAADLLATLEELGLPYRILTNGTARTPQQYAEALHGLGLQVPDDSVETPASCAADLLRRHGHRRVMALGGKGVSEPLEAGGLQTVPPVRGTTVDAVFAGWYREELSFEGLEAAVFAVLDGARYYSASQSLYFASAEGKSLGTSRAISAVVRDITGCRVTTTGKPSLNALRTVAKHLGAPMSKVAVIGDDPELEVPMAHRGKALAVAVHTGIGHAGSFVDLPEQQRPHLDLPDVAAFTELLRQARHNQR
jgi:NagD protein